MRYAVTLILLVLLSSCEKAPLTLLDQAEIDFRGGRWNAVIAGCNQHLEGDPDNLTAISLRGRALLAKEDYQSAIEDFTNLIARSPEDCDPYYRRAMAYEKLGDSELALADKLRGRTLDPLRNSAYAYETSNFIDKPVLDGAAVASSTEDEDMGDATEEAPDAEENLLAEKDAETQLELELNQDRLDRESQAEEDALTAAKDAPLSDTLPSSARRQIRYGELDTDLVRDAVKGFRDMAADAKDIANRPRLTGSIPPTPGLSLDDLLGPERPSQRDQDKLSEEEQDGGENRLTPPISTALPQGYVGPRPNPGLRSTREFGGMITPRANSPLANGVPTQIQPPATSTLNPSALGVPGAPSGPYSLHANPIIPPRGGNQPTLSTSLPSGMGATGVPGVSARIPQTGAPVNPSRRLPSMLPQSSNPTQFERP